MAHARGCEVGRELSVDVIAETNQDPGRKPGLRLRHGPFQRRRGATPEVLEPATDALGRREDIETGRAQRARCPDPGEVRPVVIGRRRSDRARDQDPVVGADHRIPGQRGGDHETGWCLEAHDGRPSRPVLGPDRYDRRRPRPVAGRDRRHACRAGRAQAAKTHDEQANCDGSDAPVARAPAEPRPGSCPQAQCADSERRRRHQDGSRSDRPETECPDRGADREPDRP